MKEEFKKGLERALYNLRKKENFLNKINVFPAPDKDTGSNLVKTLSYIDGINEINSIRELSNIIMMNSRGSSGNIISLYIKGLSDNWEIPSVEELCKRASDYTWKCIYNPIEGTILSGMKAVPEYKGSVDNFLFDYISNGMTILFDKEKSPREVRNFNTLDSGLLGWIYILNGIYYGYTDKEIPFEEQIIDNQGFQNLDEDTKILLLDDYNFCVEVLLDGDADDIRSSLENEGKELIIAFSDDKTKIHIHTKDYQRVISLCKNRILDYKIENMLKNNRRIYL